MTCAPAEAAPLSALDWWHMLKRGDISTAHGPQCSCETSCNPSAMEPQWQRQTLNKQQAWLCLFSSFHCISICFFLSPTPHPLSASVSPCYFSLPYVVHPSSAFSPNVPTEADLMDDPLLWRLGSPWGPLPSSVGICVRCDRANSDSRLPLSVSMCVADIRGICIEGWQDVSAVCGLIVGNGQYASLSLCPVVLPPTHVLIHGWGEEGQRWN